MFNSPTFNMLRKSTDLATLQHKVISNNIANLDTPNFKRSEVSFAEVLNYKLGHRGKNTPVENESNPKHFRINTRLNEENLLIEQDKSALMNNNLNNVDIDVEMIKLAQNQLYYNLSIQQINHDFRMARIAIDKGR